MKELPKNEQKIAKQLIGRQSYHKMKLKLEELGDWPQATFSLMERSIKKDFQLIILGASPYRKRPAF